MGITQKFSMAQIRSQIQSDTRKMKVVTLDALVEVGKVAVRNSRDVGAYSDRTRNLRSSNFFIIIQDGERVYEDFAEAGTGPEGPAGVERARTFAAEIERGYEGYSGLALILGTGMQYAAAVESKGYDVLTTTGFKAEDMLKRALKNLFHG